MPANTPPQPPIELKNLQVGDKLTYCDELMRFAFIVTHCDEDRGLPVVDISSSQVDSYGVLAVDRLNRAGMRGILLGSCALVNGKVYYEGRVYQGMSDSGLLVEMIDEGGELIHSAFPTPTGQPVEVVH